MNGLTCGIFESKRIGNCSNYGISSRCKTVVLLGIKRLDGTFEPTAGVFSSNPDMPPVIIEERKPCGKLYYTAYPCDDDGEKLDGMYMMGGCYIKTSDSRFPFDYPIPLHDRIE